MEDICQCLSYELKKINIVSAHDNKFTLKDLQGKMWRLRQNIYWSNRQQL